MKSLTKFIQEACKGNNCKNKKILQDILNNKKRLKEINDILGESLEEINESNSQNDIDKFKLWIDAQLSYQTEEDEDIEVGFSKDMLIDKIKEFNQETHSHLQYDEHIQEITDKLADAESRNAEAAAAIDDAARAISDCSQLNRDSAEIFRRYAGRNTGK